VKAGFRFVLPGLDDIRTSPELDGGALMDVGCYCVSGSRLLAGEPERVSGEQVVGQTGIDMSFHGTMRFPGDVVAQFDCSFALPRYQRLEVDGDEGSLVVESPWRTDWEGALLLHRDGGVERIEVPTGDAYRLELENFAGAAAGTASPRIGGADALGQARTIDALYRAAEEGRAVDL
jgi:D-xylose 1-dehydrogenase (NADP+, D-xylono-1,5-lactone-forming)